MQNNTTLEAIISNLREAHKIQIDSMTDSKLVDTWKVYHSKSKRFKLGSKENIQLASIAQYAMVLHNRNRKSILDEKERVKELEIQAKKELKVSKLKVV